MLVYNISLKKFYKSFCRNNSRALACSDSPNWSHMRYMSKSCLYNEQFEVSSVLC